MWRILSSIAFRLYIPFMVLYVAFMVYLAGFFFGIYVFRREEGIDVTPRDPNVVELAPYLGHLGSVRSIAFSPDDRFALSGGEDGLVKLWDLASRREMRVFRGHTDQVASVAFSPDGRLALSGSEDRSLKLWEIATGKELRSFPDDAANTAHPFWGIQAVAFSPDGRRALAGSRQALTLWDVDTGQKLQRFTSYSGGVPDIGISSVAFSPDGRLALSGSYGNTLTLWDLAAGIELRRFSGHTEPVLAVAYSPDGRFALSGSADGTMKLWNAATGQEVRTFASNGDSVAFSPDGRFALGLNGTPTLWEVAAVRKPLNFKSSSSLSSFKAVAFSHDGRFILSGGRNGIILWSTATAREVHRFTRDNVIVKHVAFSPDGGRIISHAFDSLRVWDAKTGRGVGGERIVSPDASPRREPRFLDGTDVCRYTCAVSPDGRLVAAADESDSLVLNPSWGFGLWETSTGYRLRTIHAHKNRITALAISPDGRRILSGSKDTTLKLWDAATGRELHHLRGHADQITSADFSPDGRFAVSGSYDGTVRLWNMEAGREVAVMISRDDDWLTLTSEGFFSSSHRDTDLVALVRGLDVATIGQVHQSLLNPDLVRAAMAGDQDGDVKRAAEVLNLEKVLEAGPAPAVTLVSPKGRASASTDLLNVSARIADRGKGIGRIEWRVNGVTASVLAAPSQTAPDLLVDQTLALNAGENEIEVIAYERRNLIASLPARATVEYDGPSDTTKPKLFLLAIGINRYVDRGGSDGRFLPLAGSVPDARAFSAEIEKAAIGPYETVRVTLALDEDATLDKLDEAVTKIAGEISPRDTFVLYAAAHGYSLDGNYYMIPQDYQGGANPDALKTRAIDQERIQDWLAKRIKARRALILLDTCQSGALTSGYAKSRTEGLVSEAAVGRLHEAIGRPVLTAAASGKSAYENYKGHGVFTYALMEALRRGDTNDNGKIEVTELAAYVQDRVPELFAELKTNGWVVKGVTVAAARGGGDDAQSAHFGSTGEDFAIVARLP